MTELLFQPKTPLIPRPTKEEVTEKWDKFVQLVKTIPKRLKIWERSPEGSPLFSLLDALITTAGRVDPDPLGMTSFYNPLTIASSVMKTKPTGWISKLEEVAKTMPNKMEEKAVSPFLLGKGVKPEEMKWRGVEEFLSGKGMVKKEKFLNYLAENQIEVREVLKGNDPYSMSIEKFKSENQYKVDILKKHGYDIVQSPYTPDDIAFNRIGSSQYFTADELLKGETRDSLIDAVRNLEYNHTNFSTTKFSQWQLPGGENYRELLLTLPAKTEFTTQEMIAMKKRSQMYRNAANAFVNGQNPNPSFETYFESIHGLHPSQFSPRTVEAAKRTYEYELKNNQLVGDFNWNLAEADRLDKLVMHKGYGRFTSSHFDEPNVLAHIRFNDRVDAKGKKVLFIEEVQSDWHQAGREKGYSKTYTDIPEPYKLSADAKGYKLNDPFTGGEVDLWTTNINEAKSNALEYLNKKGIPEAPFSKTWHELAMKRMVRWAVDNGYDSIAWTTGAQQAKRYSQLLKDVTQVGVSQRPNDQWMVTVKTRSGQTVLNKVIPTSELKGTVGSKVTQDILATKGENVLGEQVRLLNYPDGITIGGEGMSGFYDKMLVDSMNKFGKKWQTSVREMEIQPGPTRSQSYPNELIWPNKEYVHSLDITPKMRKSVINEGLPLFSLIPLIILSQKEKSESQNDPLIQKLNKLAGGK